MEACSNRIHAIDGWILKMVRIGFAEPIAAKLGFGKDAMMMVAFGLAMMTALMQDSLLTTVYLMVIFSFNILLMFINKTVAELNAERSSLDLPGYIKDLPKELAEMRMFTGTLFLLSGVLYLTQGHWLGTISYLSFILMQYAAAWTPSKTVAA